MSQTGTAQPLQAAEPAAGPAGYLPVDIALLRPGPDRAFDLYQRLNQQMVLFCAGRVQLSPTDLQALANRGSLQVYVPVEQGPALSRTIERVLHETLQDPSLGAQRRGQILHAAAQGIMADVLANPTATDAVRRSAALARTTVHFMLETPGAMETLAGLFGHDYYSFLHSVHTCMLGVGLYRHLVSPDAEDLRRFGLAMLLHDVGKSMLESELLNKPGRLSASEFQTIRSHPLIGWNMLELNGMSDPLIRQAVLHHHEKLDGTGYPSGLRGPEITREARIAAIVDVYDALTTDRPYRPAMTSQAALELMTAQMLPGHLDPEYFHAFVGLIRRLPTRPPPEP